MSLQVLRGGRGWQVSRDFKAMKFTYDNYSLSTDEVMELLDTEPNVKHGGGCHGSTAYYLLITYNARLEQLPVHDIT